MDAIRVALSPHSLGGDLCRTIGIQLESTETKESAKSALRFWIAELVLGRCGRVRGRPRRVGVLFSARPWRERLPARRLCASRWRSSALPESVVGARLRKGATGLATGLSVETFADSLFMTIIPWFGESQMASAARRPRISWSVSWIRLLWPNGLNEDGHHTGAIKPGGRIYLSARENHGDGLGVIFGERSHPNLFSICSARSRSSSVRVDVNGINAVVSSTIGYQLASDFWRNVDLTQQA